MAVVAEALAAPPGEVPTCVAKVVSWSASTGEKEDGELPPKDCTQKLVLALPYVSAQTGCDVRVVFQSWLVEMVDAF